MAQCPSPPPWPNTGRAETPREVSFCGHAIAARATLCVLDRRVRGFSAAEQQLLERYAQLPEPLCRA